MNTGERISRGLVTPGGHGAKFLPPTAEVGANTALYKSTGQSLLGIKIRF